jgi:hypothetical protein
VNLFADLFARRQRHEDQLQVRSRVEYAAVIAVVVRELLNIRDKALHVVLLDETRLRLSE